MKTHIKKGRLRVRLGNRLKTIKQKIFKIEDSPEKIAKGFALGTFIGMTPLVGLQFIISVLIARVLHWNKIAAGIAVFNTNVITGSFFFGINYLIGNTILNLEGVSDLSLTNDTLLFINIFDSGYFLFLALIIGGFITGLPAALFAYFLVKRIFLKKQGNDIEFEEVTVNNKNEYALITGASKGLGREFAFELASRKINLLLVALKDECLPELCCKLKSMYSVDVDCLEIDLAKDSSLQNISAWLGERKISILVNNAGIGGSCGFEGAGLNYLDKIIQINVRSLSLLTWLLLPKLKECSRSYILNVASMASFSPIAYKTIYPASKAFVYNFSLCLREELKNTNISVSVLHPGPMATNFDVTSRINSQSRFAKLSVLTPENVARIAINGLFNLKTVIIPGITNKFNWLMMKLIPSKIKIPLISFAVRRELSLT